MNSLSPVDAADLARAVYALNEGNPASLKVFLNNPLFASKTTKVIELGKP